MYLSRFYLLCLAVCLGGAGLLVVPVDGQPPGNNVATVLEQRPDGTVVQRTIDGKVLRMQSGPPSGLQTTQFGWTTQHGLTFVPGMPSPFAQDAESKKLIDQEQAAAQEVRQLASQAQKAASTGETSDAKAILRQKLAQIFDLQQQRRTHEIAKIEERLGKLKDTLKKRETSKDSIVDRRLETLTGGVDELGWEETFPNEANPYGPKGPNTLSYPPVVPRAGYPVPGYGPPSTAPVPAPAGQPSLTPPPVAPALPNLPRAEAAPAAVNPLAVPVAPELPAFAPAPAPAAAEPPAAIPVPAAPPVPAVAPAPSASSML